MKTATSNLECAYALARERYRALGVDPEAALETLARIPVSLHCWQGDDVGGFENFGGTLGGGLVASGNYPGKARTPDELRADLEKAFSLIPGKHRLNLHACYGEFGGKKVDRDEITPAHFKNWIAWAKQNGIGMDFNPTCFSHPKAADGFTLSHADKDIRRFWIEHCIRCREIGAAIGQGAWKNLHHQRLDPGRHEGHAGGPQRPARGGWRNPSTRSSKSRFHRN